MCYKMLNLLKSGCKFPPVPWKFLRNLKRRCFFTKEAARSTETSGMMTSTPLPARVRRSAPAHHHGASLVSLSAPFPGFILSVACALQEWPSFFAPFPGQFSCSCSLIHSFRVRCLFLSNSSYKLESHVPQMILSLIRRSFMSLKYMCMPEFSATRCKHLSSSLLLAFGI